MSFPEPSFKHLIYIAGAYVCSAENPSTTMNIAVAQQVGYRYLKSGYNVFIPHMNWGWLTMEEAQPSYDQMMEICLCVLKRCDGIVMVRNWWQSNGARIERDFAKVHNIPIAYDHVNDFTINDS